MQVSLLADPCLEECDEIYYNIVEKVPIRELMRIVREYRDRDIYIVIDRKTRKFFDLTFSVYEGEDLMFVPVPKRFAVLEPDEHYFEVTLKANIVLALKGERDYHR